MTVAEAIEELKKMPQQSVLLRADNSFGYEGVTNIKTEEAIETVTGNRVLAVVME